MNASVASDFISLIYYLHHIGLFYNVAAASIAPAALNNALFVYLTSTAYIHSMYFAQPVSESVTVPKPRLHRNPQIYATQKIRLTPISTLPSEIFPHVRHNNHCEQELDLLQAGLPLLLRIGAVFRTFVRAIYR
jgi:hypothetical protein